MSGPMPTPPGFNHGPGAPPPGYGQGPRPMQPQYPQPMQGQYAPGQQFSPPGYPQYGPPGYYPQPQKSGFPTWAIVLIVCLVVGPFLVGILAVAAIPLIASNTDEARSSEARAALGAMKDRARVVYQRNPAARIDKYSLGLGPTELNGSYFTDANYSVFSSDAHNWGARCTGVYAKSPPYDLEIRANLVSGIGTFNRER